MLTNLKFARFILGFCSEAGRTAVETEPERKSDEKEDAELVAEQWAAVKKQWAQYLAAMKKTDGRKRRKQMIMKQ